jgi:hypothetical protein
MQTPSPVVPAVSSAPAEIAIDCTADPAPIFEDEQRDGELLWI